MTKLGLIQVKDNRDHLKTPTLTFLIKSAEAKDRWMFSDRENCCRIPPTDNTVEAREY